MGLISFGVGLCCGYYLRNTQFGKDLGKKFLAVSKTFMDKNIKEYKLVLVVRDDLNMGRGKIASQCCHATIMAYRTAASFNPAVATFWEAFGQAKVVLRTSNGQSLIELLRNAEQMGLYTNVVCDAGRTQVSSGTKTVLAIGPGFLKMNPGEPNGLRM